MELRTGENDSGRRLDRVLRKALRNYPLPLLHRFLRQGLVLVDGKPAKAQDRVTSGALISIPSIKNGAAERSVHSPAPSESLAQAVDNKVVQKHQFLNNYLEKPAVFQAVGRKTARLIRQPGRLSNKSILWQGPGLLAVNKPSGLPVHGPGSLDTMVRAYLAEKLPASLSFTPGPLHRLDKPSSGIVVFSTSIEGARHFSRLLRERKVRKTYLALVEGIIENEEIWQDELVRDTNLKKTFVGEKPGAKTAITTVRPLASYGNYCLVMAEISTGRTHQIRAQAGDRGRPLAGDQKYGGSSLKNPHGRAGFFLHAWKMEFDCLCIEAPLPPAFRAIINHLLQNC